MYLRGTMNAAKIQFKEYNQGEILLFPSRLDENISESSPVRLISQVVDQLDITPILATYEGGGTTGYHPRMMLKVLFYAYLNNIYSCRKIEKCLEENIHYMWLSGKQFPDFRTINNFRSLHLKDSIHEMFTQIIMLLVEMGYLSLKTIYVDGTKIESAANRYSFVWRKSVEKHKEKLENKIRTILKQVEEGIYQDNQEQEQLPSAIDSEVLKERIAAINKENRSKQEQKAIKVLEEKHLPKLQEYEQHLKILGNRNSYSKTDKDATFMRMKEDHMMNGQLKPAYNVQVSTENQFVTHYDFFPNPTDTLTLKPFMEGFEQRFKAMPEVICADSGYGSEENYEFLQANELQAFVKYNYFHKESKRSFKNNPFLTPNLFYNAKENYYVCPMGQHLNHKYQTSRESDNGYISTIDVYQASNCQGCPMRGLCYKAKGNRQIEINHNLNAHRKKARALLESEEGLYHRSRRPIEPESYFGNTKYNKQYNRFRHYGQDMVKMDYALLAIAHNLAKLLACLKNKSKSPLKTSKKRKDLQICLLITLLFTKRENYIQPCSQIFRMAA